jgi:3-hydroxyacyl-[acyl-carrier-protein] dehydratase
MDDLAARALDGLPHRAPFRFLDAIEEIADDRGRGVWRVRGDEDFLRGHFPGRPLVPGVLITEAAAQLGGAVAHHAATVRGEAGSGAGMLVLSEARFKRPVEPPAAIELEVVLDRVMGTIHRFDFTATVGGAVVALGAIAVSLAPAESTS